MISPLTSLSLLFHLSAGVVSVSFEEDEEGNLCLIAYPLHSDLGDLENVDPSAELEPNNKIKRISKKLLDNEGYSKDRSRHARKDKDKRWEDGNIWLCSRPSNMHNRCKNRVEELKRRSVFVFTFTSFLFFYKFSQWLVVRIVRVNFNCDFNNFNNFNPPNK